MCAQSWWEKNISSESSLQSVPLEPQGRRANRLSHPPQDTAPATLPSGAPALQIQLKRLQNKASYLRCQDRFSVKSYKPYNHNCCHPHPAQFLRLCRLLRNSRGISRPHHPEEGRGCPCPLRDGHPHRAIPIKLENARRSDHSARTSAPSRNTTMPTNARVEKPHRPINLSRSPDLPPSNSSPMAWRSCES
jgi:hypothetical protein